LPKKLVDVEVRGEKEAALDLLKLGIRARDLRPASRKLFRVFEEAEKAQFGSGRGWPRLAPSTLEEKAAEGFPSTVLVRTGVLRDSLAARGSGAVRGANEPGEGEVTFGTTVPYAKYALGTKRQPPRPLIKLRVSDRTAITKVLSEYIVKGRS